MRFATLLALAMTAAAADAGYPAQQTTVVRQRTFGRTAGYGVGLAAVQLAPAYQVPQFQLAPATYAAPLAAPACQAPQLQLAPQYAPQAGCAAPGSALAPLRAPAYQFAPARSTTFLFQRAGGY